MEIILLDDSFTELYVLDAFTSLIWTDRYWKCGDFEIVTTPTADILAKLLDTSYLKLAESPHHMILEDSNIHSEIEEGNELVLTGRSLESILDRRIAWRAIAMSGNFQSEVERLFDDNIIDPPENPLREITELVFNTSTDPIITALTIDTQFNGESIYKIMKDLCQTNGIGFRILRDLVTDKFNFELYAGVDRSYDQSTNETVAFTTALDNLINSDYIESSRSEKTVCLVAGSAGVGNIKTTKTVYATGKMFAADLVRRELYFEASVSRNTPDGELSEADYLLQLEGRGEEELAKYIYVKAFDGEVDPTMYNYGDEFNMGDILQIADDYGHGTKSRVTEVIYSQDESAIAMYPTFETVE
jgi:hypothetical protein